MLRPSLLILLLSFALMAIARGATYNIPDTNIVLTYEISAETDAIIITDCNDDASGELVIPSTIEGKPVLAIGDSAFWNCRNLTSVIIPDSVVTIGQGAFGYCRSITSVTIGNRVTSIGDEAFSNCGLLTSITIPSSVIVIGDEVFSFCRSLLSIEVAQGNPAYSSGNGVLFNADQTRLVTYPGGIRSTVYTIPDSVANIGNKAFTVCVYLENIIIPNSVVTIESRAFWVCGRLESITLPSSVTSIAVRAFESCFRFASIEVDPDNTHYMSLDGVLYSKDQAFLHTYPENREGATYSIPEGVTTIGEGAFLGSNNLISLTIPSSVVSIGKSAILNALQLTSVIFEGDAPTDINFLNFFNAPNAGNPSIYFYEGAIGFTTPTWKSMLSYMLSRLESFDRDKDGWPDSLEILLGTVIDNPNDAFRTWFSRNSGMTRVHYGPHSDACTFVVECTTDLSDPESWEPLDDLIFNGDQVEQMAELTTPSGEATFYRIRVGHSP